MNRAALALALVAAGLASACQGNADATPSPGGVVADAPAPAVLPPPGIQTPDAPPVAATPTPGETPDKPFGDRIVLQPDMAADLAPATTLAFERIVSDSRCPKGAQCVWAGEVTVAMKLVTPLGSKSFELSGGNNKVSALGNRVELLEYGPCPGGPAITPLPGECAQLTAVADPAP